MRRIVTHMIVPQSPQYETNEPVLPPPRPRVTSGLRASNAEIDDELRMYSTVQSYEPKKHFTQKGAPPGGNEWLKRTLQNRLYQSG